MADENYRINATISSARDLIFTADIVSSSIKEVTITDCIAFTDIGSRQVKWVDLEGNIEVIAGCRKPSRSYGPQFQHH